MILIIILRKDIQENYQSFFVLSLAICLQFLSDYQFFKN